MLWEQASGHPNVLPIIDADEYDGQVVIVSEYADGGSLADKIKADGKLSLKLAVEITLGILNGLEFLHSKQIIHRDIKPQNILLQGNTPRLADFGISRAMNTSTISSVVIGTDAYMSPESFEGKRNIQTDIWSVGVLLYQLLANNLPFSQEHPSERMFAILMTEPQPLSYEIPLKLREIVQKAMAKAPENRYQTAGEMRDALQSMLVDINHPGLAKTEPLIVIPKDTIDDIADKIITKPETPLNTPNETILDTQIEIIPKQATNSKTYEPTVLLTDFSPKQAQTTETAFETKKNLVNSTEKTKLDFSLFIVPVLGIIGLFILVFGLTWLFQQIGKNNSTQISTNSGSNVITKPPTTNPNTNSAPTSSKEIFTLLHSIPYDAGVDSISFSADGKTVVSNNIYVQVWDVESGKRIREIGYATYSVAFNPDGKSFASASNFHDEVWFWNAKNGGLIRTFKNDFPPGLVAFSPDGKILSAGYFKIALWDLSSGRKIRTLPEQSDNNYVGSVAFSPDSKMLATALENGSLYLWDVAAGTVLRSFSGLSDYPKAISFSPDGKILAAPISGNKIKLWNVNDGTEIRTLSGHTDSTRSASFSPDGKLLASSSKDGTVKIWNPADGTLLQTLTGHISPISMAVFSPDGKNLASATASGGNYSLKIWKLKE